MTLSSGEAACKVAPVKSNGYQIDQHSSRLLKANGINKQSYPPPINDDEKAHHSSSRSTEKHSLLPIKLRAFWNFIFPTGLSIAIWYILTATSSISLREELASETITPIWAAVLVSVLPCLGFLLPSIRAARSENPTWVLMLLGFIQSLYVQTLFYSFLLEGVALTYTIKALEPIGNLCLLRLAGKPTHVTPLSFLGLCCLPCGIFLSQVSSKSWTLGGLGFALFNVVLVSFRSVLLKLYTYDPSMSYFHISACSLSALIPAALYYVRQDFHPWVWMASSNLLFGVLSFVGYNYASFFVLSKVDPVLHAACNVLKRCVTVGISILIMPRGTLSPQQLLGICITFVSLGVYACGRSLPSVNSKLTCICLGLAMAFVVVSNMFLIYPHVLSPFSVTRHVNRTLIILNGSPRGGEAAWNSLYTQVLDVNQADLALAFGESSNRNSSLYSRAKYIWEFPEYEDWGTALDQIGTGWRRWANKDNIMGGVNGTRGSGAIILWIRWFVKGQLQREPGLLGQYSWFVYTRSDHYYLCPHDLRPFKQDPHTLYIPSGQDYGGYTDRHLVASDATILRALSIIDNVAKTENPRELEDNNVEHLIKRRWSNMNLTVIAFNRMMFTCAVTGDKTRWGEPKSNFTPSEILALGIALKYPDEYYDAKRYCHAASANRTDIFHPTPGCTSQPAPVCGSHIDCINPKSSCSPIPNIGMYHFVPYGYNFGDVIGSTVNNFASRGMAQLMRTKERNGTGTLIVTLGSVLHHVLKTKKKVHLWGTGHVGAKYHNYTEWKDWGHTHPRMEVHAVRGQLTLDFLYANDIVINTTKKANVVLGDPALLLPYIYPQCRRDTNPSRSVCLILHNNDRNINSPRGVFHKNIWHSTLDYHEMLENILECKLVLSSSLHGIIVAEAFGVPARWVKLPGSAKSEGAFKYCDYYTGSRINDPSMNVSALMRDNGKGICIGFDDEDNPFKPAKTVAEALILGGAPPIRGYDSAKLLQAFPLKLVSERCSPLIDPVKMMIGADLRDTPLIDATTQKGVDFSQPLFPQDEWYSHMLAQTSERCKHISHFFHHFLPHLKCDKPRRFGNCGDGSKVVCLDNFSSSSSQKNTERASKKNERCVVYSFGSSDDSCFETAIARETNCEIHIFDPTSDKLTDDRWTYHSYGLTGKNASFTSYWDWRTQGRADCSGCQMKNLRDIMLELGHDWIDVLKVDIDGAEWRSFDFVYEEMGSLPASQVQIEMTGLDITDLSDSLAGGTFGVYKLWSRLFNDGFRIFHLEPNLGTCVNRNKDRSASFEYALWRGKGWPGLNEKINTPST